METAKMTQAQHVEDSYTVPRSMRTVRYPQPRTSSARWTEDRPGLQRFRTLPEPVAQVVLEFLEEVKRSTPEYTLAYSRAWRDFLQRFSLIFFEPFQSPRHFASRDRLSETELMSYTVNLISALRPILLVFRDSTDQACEPTGPLTLFVNRPVSSSGDEAAIPAETRAGE